MPSDRADEPNHPRTLDDLEGSQGREVYFRAQRYRSADLGAVSSSVAVEIDGVLRSQSLLDFSQSGVAFAWPQGEPMPEPGSVIRWVVVSFDAHDVYRGGLRVNSVRTLDGENIVGASFVDSVINVEDVLHLQQLRDLGGTAGLDPSRHPWSVPGHDRFKAQILDMRLFFDEADAKLAELEAKLPWNLVHGEGDSLGRRALIEQMRNDFTPTFVRYSELLDAACRGASPEEWSSMKALSQRLLHDRMMRAPFLHRCRVKPLGYPGDFEVMRFIYERQFEGVTLFGKALHQAVVHTRGATAVRTRKDLLKARLRERVDGEAAKERSRPLRIASIAAGPAQEIYEFFSEREGALPPMELVLFDQDPLALAYAQARVSRQVARFPTVKAIYLQDSIRRLLNDPQLFEGLGPFDLIFCAGLFDYLKAGTASRLTASFVQNLAPGGTCYIGNMTPENPCRWFLEQHLEWYLLYRTRQEMLDFATVGAPDAQVSIVEDGTGVNPFVAVHRP